MESPEKNNNSSSDRFPEKNQLEKHILSNRKQAAVVHLVGGLPTRIHLRHSDGGRDMEVAHPLGWFWAQRKSTGSPIPPYHSRRSDARRNQAATRQTCKIMVEAPQQKTAQSAKRIFPTSTNVADFCGSHFQMVSMRCLSLISRWRR